MATARLDLVPASVALLDAELDSPDRLGSTIGATVPADWPPGEYDRDAIRHFRARLTEHPESIGWHGWYVLLRRERQPTLIGAGGYFGPPDGEGTVEIGCSIAREFQGRGYATELVRGLANHAFATGAVKRVRARTREENISSVRVLEKNGFRRTSQDADTGSVIFELPGPGTATENR